MNEGFLGHMKEQSNKKTIGSVGLLLLFTTSLLLVWLFVQIYATPKPLIIPSDIHTSATSGQTQIGQMKSFENDATKVTSELNLRNNQTQNLLTGEE